MRRILFLPLAALASLLTSASFVHAADTSNAAVCSLLKKAIPAMQGQTPASAKASLVISLTEDYEPDDLFKFWRKLDQIAIASCPKERAAILALTQTKTLDDAIH